MPRTVTQPDHAPTRKVSTAGVSGAVATLAVWLLTTLGVDVPPEAAGALATLAGFAGAYLVRDVDHGVDLDRRLGR